jgi:hypothetical protein
MRKRCRKSGKVKFPSHESAAKRAGEILLKSDAKELGTYLCPHCNKWHLTSQTGKWVTNPEWVNATHELRTPDYTEIRVGPPPKRKSISLSPKVL